MFSISAAAVARLARAACIAATVIATGAITYAATDTPAPGNASTATPAAKNNDTGVLASPDIAKTKPVPTTLAKPLWAELTPAQQQALTPLAAEWDRLDALNKKKWLAISRKFATLQPDQQLRLQNRMRDWAKFTPEQRRVARESFARAKKLNPGQKTAEWQQYQQLPEEQKKKLAADAAAKKRVANLPPASQAKNKIIPPPKSALQTGTERPITAPATNSPATQSSPQPATK